MSSLVSSNPFSKEEARWSQFKLGVTLLHWSLNCPASSSESCHLFPLLSSQEVETEREKVENMLKVSEENVAREKTELLNVVNARFKELEDLRLNHMKEEAETSEEMR